MTEASQEMGTESAAPDIAAAPVAPVGAPALNPNGQVVAEGTVPPNAEATQVSNLYDFVNDKYRTGNRTEEEALQEQAKAYNELSGKFGAFTGAPKDGYEVALSEEMAEHINMDDYADDPLMNEFKEKAQEMGINNDGFNQITEMYFKSQMAEQESLATVRDEEMKLLGNNADRRLDAIQDWTKANMDSTASEQIAELLTSAKAVEAVENLISKTRNVPQAVESAPPPTVSHDELRAMQTAVDEFGQSKMNNAAYARRVRALYDLQFGADPHNITIGK